MRNREGRERETESGRDEGEVEKKRIHANLNMYSIYVAPSACSANLYTRELIWAQLAACKYVCI